MSSPSLFRLWYHIIPHNQRYMVLEKWRSDAFKRIHKHLKETCTTVAIYRHLKCGLNHWPWKICCYYSYVKSITSSCYICFSKSVLQFTVWIFHFGSPVVTTIPRHSTELWDIYSSGFYWSLRFTSFDVSNIFVVLFSFLCALYFC